MVEFDGDGQDGNDGDDGDFNDEQECMKKMEDEFDGR